MILADAMPYEFDAGEFDDAPAFKMRDVEVVEHHHLEGFEQAGNPWPGKHKHVWYWVVLENGYAVGFNQNPSRGWSFPVIRYKAQK